MRHNVGVAPDHIMKLCVQDMLPWLGAHFGGLHDRLIYSPSPLSSSDPPVDVHGERTNGNEGDHIGRDAMARRHHLRRSSVKHAGTGQPTAMGKVTTTHEVH